MMEKSKCFNLVSNAEELAEQKKKVIQQTKKFYGLNVKKQLNIIKNFCR